MKRSNFSEYLKDWINDLYWQYEFINTPHKKHKIVMKIYQGVIYNFKVLHNPEWMSLSEIWRDVNKYFKKDFTTAGLKSGEFLIENGELLSL